MAKSPVSGFLDTLLGLVVLVGPAPTAATLVGVGSAAGRRRLHDGSARPLHGNRTRGVHENGMRGLHDNQARSLHDSPARVSDGRVQPGRPGKGTPHDPNIPDVGPRSPAHGPVGAVKTTHTSTEPAADRVQGEPPPDPVARDSAVRTGRTADERETIPG